MQQSFISDLVNRPAISRIRRNHGLEHATIHLLSARFPRKPLAGHSDAGGFWLLGDVPTEAVQETVQQALARMKGGEHRLAVHPNCGTNLVTSGTMAGLAGAVAMLGAGKKWRDRIDRFSLAAMLATLALIISQPLGLWLQEKVTTSGQPGALEVVDIIFTQKGKFPAHRVLTRG